MNLQFKRLYRVLLKPGVEYHQIEEHLYSYQWKESDPNKTFQSSSGWVGDMYKLGKIIEKDRAERRRRRYERETNRSV